MNGNSKEDLWAWATKAVSESDRVSTKGQQLLLGVASKVISSGGLRGNISDEWRKFEWVTIQLVPDLYI